MGCGVRYKKLIVFILPIILLVLSFISCSQDKSSSTPVEISADEPKPAVEVGSLDISEYRLKIDGLVDHPLSLTYESIIKYPSVTESLLLVCPGLFETNQEWTGVPLAIILKEASLKPEAREIMFVASDGYKAYLSLPKAQEDGTFLAYKVDGKILSKDDGYPIRLVVKDLYGSNWVRWLEHIEVI